MTFACLQPLCLQTGPVMDSPFANCNNPSKPALSTNTNVVFKIAAKVFRHFLMTKEMNSQDPQMSVLLLLDINPDGTTEFQQQKSWRGAL